MKQEMTRGTRLRECAITYETCSILQRNGIVFIDDLLNLSWARLSALYVWSPSAVKEVITFLYDNGFISKATVNLLNDYLKGEDE